MYFQLRIRFFCLAVTLVCVSGDLAAQLANEDEGVVNYAYAVVFGTGTYKVNDQTAFVLRAPFYYRVREPSSARPGMRLLLPALVGYYDYDYDRAFQGGLPGDAATTSFVPGLEFEYEVNERWRIKPYGQLGFGRDLKNNENAWIYAGGVTSNYKIPCEGKWRFALGNTAAYAGYDPEDDAVQSLGILGIGIDMIYPWGVSVFGKETHFANHLIYYWYLDSPGFKQGEDRAEKVSGEVEWGLSLGFEKPPTLLGLEFQRIGLGFRYGDDIKGIRVVTQFPF